MTVGKLTLHGFAYAIKDAVATIVEHGVPRDIPTKVLYCVDGAGLEIELCFDTPDFELFQKLVADQELQSKPRIETFTESALRRLQ